VISVGLAVQARIARAELEDALGPDVRAWRWSAILSRLIDGYVLLEERTA
jgi:hypothetical protein